ncbi:NAD(P)H-hydrate dehydratase [Rhodobacteraceae bacterium CCMM004]|nr:NAD(P)H-hydrate dehydratase [Rhodobacteraceae bacterium CCMM004]
MVLDAALAAPLAKTAAQHKYDHGHCVVLSGGVGRGGAARLAARAALRVGAGLVTLAPPPAALIENAAQLTAVMLRKVADGPALAGWLAADGRITALVVGPGLGTGARETDLVAAALTAGRPLVLDADALTLIAGDDALRGAVPETAVLTPHGGEFRRLWPDIAVEGADAAARAAAEIGATVLLKGAETWIASPGGEVAVHRATGDRAAPWLATAGAGDVLSGLIGGALSRGMAPMAAAALGTALHAACGRAAGPGLIAEDLPDALPAVLRDLGL